MRRRRAAIGLALGTLGLLSFIALGGVDAARQAIRAHSTPQLEVPAGWPAPHYRFESNPVTAAGFALGRQLFYDTELSQDGSVACGSCHQQFAAFAHLDHRVSHGIGGVNGKRNAPGLFNLAWQLDFMWDGASTHLETQPILPISNPVEMGSSIKDVVAKLRADPRYPPRFEAAFGDPQIDAQRTLRALAQFTGTLVSANAHYDRVMAGREHFSPDESAGLTAFRAHCSACHVEPLFTDFSYRSNGLDVAPHDRGRAGISDRMEDTGRFRVPSLRNVALTAPYMHDGRYDSLDQVLDHYRHGISSDAVVDPVLARGIPLSDDEQRELVAFLQSLTDDTFIADPRYAEVSE